MSSLISFEEVRLLLENRQAVIVDCRFVFSEPSSGYASYLEEHLPGALYLDLEQDLSGPVGPHGGRHPLPDFLMLADKLGAMGVDNDILVIAYDDQGGAMAARLWWLLRYMGHAQVKVMQAGYSSWKAAGHPVTGHLPETQPHRFLPRLQNALQVGMEEVKARIGTASTLIDSRQDDRYSGEAITIDTRSGHIPGATNRFWEDGLTAEGTFKDAAGQRERFKDLDPDQEIVVYCGSGITGCPNILALTEAGFRNVLLYPGSWSDWISYEENPVAKGKE